MGKIYTTTVTLRPALPRSRYRTSVSYSGGSSAAQGGSSGAAGKDGVGIASVETTGSSASGGVNVVTISLTDGTSSKFNVRNGYDGAAGKSAYEVAVDEGFDGTEADWLESLRGKPGSRGGIGPEGKSAYEIAVKEGFEGDVTEWLDSLKGDSGRPGKDGVGIASVEATGSSASGGVNVVTITLADGTSSKFNVRNGYDGAAGKSAYEVAVDEGFDGTEAAWLESLKGETGARGGVGPDGKNAYEVAVKEGFEGDVTEWLDSLKGDSGRPGKDGVSGQAAGFGTPAASAAFIPVGEDPTAEVEASGPDTAKVFSFRFGIPATAKDILAQLKVRPVLTAIRGLNEDDMYVQGIIISHPLLKSSDYKAVLMVYRRRNCRVVGTRANGDKLRMSKKGWAVALGDYRLTGHVALTANGGFKHGASFGYTQLRDFIVQRFMTDSGHTAEELFSRTYEQWKSESNLERGFGLRRRARCRFGIAVRYENPAFTAAVDASRSLDPTTQVIWDANNNRFERYLYSDVAPLDVMLASPPDGSKRSELWFGLAER